MRAADARGNDGTTSVGFVTPEERRGVELGGPADGSEVAAGVELSAVVSDPTDDIPSGSFNVGHRLTVADGQIALTCAVTPAGDSLVALDLLRHARHHPRVKFLTPTAFTADILTTEQIGTFADVESGSTVTATWAAPSQGAGWYVVARDGFGGEAISEVCSVDVTEASPSPTPTEAPSTASPTPTKRPMTAPSPECPGQWAERPLRGARLPRPQRSPLVHAVRAVLADHPLHHQHLGHHRVRGAAGFEQSNEWVVNNMIYLPYQSRAAWAANPLGHARQRTDDSGRNWRTECDTAATGRGRCRTWVEASVITSDLVDAQRTHRWSTQWVFNNLVRFKD